jgi:hypothetical protein
MVVLVVMVVTQGTVNYVSLLLDWFTAICDNNGCGGSVGGDSNVRTTTSVNVYASLLLEWFTATWGFSCLKW